MSTSYQDFAYVYDKFMDNIPYEKWSKYLTRLFHKYSVTNGTLIELGCGTGTLSLLMEKAGYNIIGIDNSTDMLTVASEKMQDNPNITLLCQDMCSLDLGSRYNGFFSICDSLNYLLTPSDILSTFCSVKNHLKKMVFSFSI